MNDDGDSDINEIYIVLKFYFRILNEFKWKNTLAVLGQIML